MEEVVKKVEKFKDKDCIYQLLRCMVENHPKEDFYAVIDRYIASQKEMKIGSCAPALEYLRNKTVKTFELKKLSNVSESVSNLLSPYAYPKKEIVLDERTQILCDELILEWKNKSLFREHNFEARNKILLYGSTGNGKTTLARNLANDVGLPFYEVKTSMMVDSKLGQTSKNVADVLSLKIECVLFFDEIDSLAVRRDDHKDHAELDRSLNVFLVQMEKLHPDVILIGATNRYDRLDSAFLRRFDVKHELPAPRKEDKLKFINSFVEKHKVVISDVDALSEKHTSYSDLEKELIDVARKLILNSIKKHDI